MRHRARREEKEKEQGTARDEKKERERGTAREEEKERGERHARERGTGRLAGGELVAKDNPLDRGGEERLGIVERAAVA